MTAGHSKTVEAFLKVLHVVHVHVNIRKILYLCDEGTGEEREVYMYMYMYINPYFAIRLLSLTL